jgi:hypothetical protein
VFLMALGRRINRQQRTVIDSSGVDTRNPAGCGSRSGHHPGLRTDTERAVEVRPMPADGSGLSSAGSLHGGSTRERPSQPRRRWRPSVGRATLHLHNPRLRDAQT